MIIFDTETTGLVDFRNLNNLLKQPKIIEFGALKVNDKLKVIDEINFMVNPNEPIPKIITKITGITDDDVKDESPFVEYYGALYEFFLGEKIMIAHNMPFDFNLLKFDLQRIGKEFNFPWPQRHICTLELAKGFEFESNKLINIWGQATGKEPKQSHRALDDCHMLLDVVKWMRKEYGVI